jgi:hypothetical protein
VRERCDGLIPRQPADHLPHDRITVIGSIATPSHSAAGLVAEAVRISLPARACNTPGKFDATRCTLLIDRGSTRLGPLLLPILSG